MKPAQVRLGINSGVWTYITWEGEVEEGSREVVLEEVANAWVPGKPSTVTCELLMGDGAEPRAPHQVIFSR